MCQCGETISLTVRKYPNHNHFQPTLDQPHGPRTQAMDFCSSRVSVSCQTTIGTYDMKCGLTWGGIHDNLLNPLP